MATRMDLFRPGQSGRPLPKDLALPDIFAPRSYARREIIFDPHAKEDLVFVVASGRVRIFFAHEDKELTLSILRPGDIYSTHTRAWVQAYKNSTILVADTGAFRKHIEEYPELTLTMARVLGDLLKKSYSHILSLAFKNVRRRLEEFLLHEARRSGRPHPHGTLVDLDMTGEQLAAMLGTTRQTVSSTLGELINEGLLAKEGRGSYIIPDMNRLRHSG
ncbi:Crp/Fnr family transcriptional regulator [Desulfocurvibacter africanus]|uniref:Crp/Fnr family transcriptional regulator n=1 Tax=Desulfocurvibacter africanus TaxID=873 RepID=UPI002FDB5C19